MSAEQTPTLRKHPDIDTVLVIGPNGNVGQHLIPALLQLGYRVRAMQYRTPVPARDGQEIVEGNTLDADAVRRAMDGVQAVCHMIRATGPGDTPSERWFNCCVAGARHMLEAAKDAGLVRYIAGSADNVFGHTTIRHPEPIRETSIKRFADDYYGLFKIVEEAMCRQYYLGKNVPVVVTRFGLIWDDSHLQKVAGALDRDAQHIYQKFDVDGHPLVRHDVHMDDVVQGILLALGRDEAVGDDFNFLADAPYSSTELTALLVEKFGYQVEPVHPGWHSWQYDNTKARSVLGFRPQVDVLGWLRAKL